MRVGFRRTNDWLGDHPRKATLALVGGAAIAYACFLVGGQPFASEGDQNLLARFVAWPGGTWPAFAIGGLVLALLLAPGDRRDGGWRWRVARITWWTTLLFATFQLLDDHLMGHPGTPNPLDLDIPSPFQDLLELPMLLVLGAALAFALLTLPRRISGRRTRA